MLNSRTHIAAALAASTSLAMALISKRCGRAEDLPQCWYPNTFLLVVEFKSDRAERSADRLASMALLTGVLPMQWAQATGLICAAQPVVIDCTSMHQPASCKHDQDRGM